MSEKKNGLLELKLETLHKIRGGALAAAFDRAIQELARDIEAAPDITEKRVVNLQIEARPILDGLRLDGVSHEIKIGRKQPARVCTLTSKSTRTAEGVYQLRFSEFAAHDPNQMDFISEGDED